MWIVMKLKFTGAESLWEGIEILSPDLGIQIVARCPKLTVEVAEIESSGLRSSLDGKNARIDYGKQNLI